MNLRTETVPNMVQGISQQAVQVRRSTQCASQFDCLNHATEGATPRPGVEPVAKLYNNTDATGAFFYDIIRDGDERYTVVITNTGALKVFNAMTGTECAVTVPEGNSAAASYLANLPVEGNAWRHFAACSADDVTFIANKTVVPAMATSPKSPERYPEALFHFRSGAYLTNYRIAIKFDSVWYEWVYQTPDNSAPTNAEYITTDAICYAMYNAMVTDPVNPVGGITGGLQTFNIERNGNMIRLWTEVEGDDFEINVWDGQGSTSLFGIKNTAEAFDDLPKGGFDGMVFKVAHDPTTDDDDYYVGYLPLDDGTGGHGWVETTKAGIPIRINSATMPVRLINTAPNTFELRLGPWADRVVGDEDSAPNPSFIGRAIENIFFDQRRLALMTVATCSWSRVNNVYQFFPDTVQTTLATAPIDVEVTSGKRIPILRHPLHVGASTYLWAEGQQFLVGQGDTTTFSNETIEVKPNTGYEWKETVPPAVIGTSVVFATEVGRYSMLTDATMQGGQPIGDTGITDHVPKLIPRDLRIVIGSDTLKKVVAFSDSTPYNLYVYEYRVSERERLQSAWNIWRLPTGGSIQHAQLDKDVLRLWIQRVDGLWLYTVSLQPSQEDVEGNYLTRLDFRVNETRCTVTYDATTNTTKVTLPYRLADTENPHVHATARERLQMVIRRTTGSGDTALYRGVVVGITSVTWDDSGVTSFVVDGDYSAAEFYIGLRIRSERTETRFYVRDEQQGYVYNERLDVRAVAISHANSGYFHAEILDRKGNVRTIKPYNPREYGDPTAVYDLPIIASGDFMVDIAANAEDFTLRWVADTYLPCSWQGMTWFYLPTNRASPGR